MVPTQTQQLSTTYLCTLQAYRRFDLNLPPPNWGQIHRDSLWAKQHHLILWLQARTNSRYHKYNMLEQVRNQRKGNRILIYLWVPQTCAYATLRQSVANLTFRNVSFNFATAISKFDASFSLFALSELVCSKKYLTLYIIPYLFTPSLFSFGALQTD